MLFYSVVIITWAATSLATPPPGYVKEPDNDKDPPAYEYRYEIGDGTGKGQGKAETRSGEFASGSYYVNTGHAVTDVKYFADDWGYHPVVKYGSTDKHGSATTQLALGEHAVKALQTGGDNVGPKVKIPGEPQKRKQVQIIQPYTIGDNDFADVPSTYKTIVSDAREPSEEVDNGAVKNSREYSSREENLPKESRGSSTILIPSLSHSTSSQEIAYTASTPPIPLAYAPLQEVRDIYANNDYQNAALIDEQLYLQSAAGNFGEKVNVASAGESGIKDFQFSTTTSRPQLLNSPAYLLTKQNGDVTYTVHSGANANTAYLSALEKTKKPMRNYNRHNNYRHKFVSVSTTTESPNYSVNSLSSTVVTPSTTPVPATQQFTRNENLLSENREKYDYHSVNGAKPSQEFTEFGPADPQLVNYGLESDNEGHSEHHEKNLETQGLSAYGGDGNNLQNRNEIESSTVSSASFVNPIVVGEVTPGYDGPEYVTIFNKCDDVVVPTTATPLLPTTSEPIISSDEIVVTPKYHNENHITTSSVVLNPIQAGVALVNAGETHLIIQEKSKDSVPPKEQTFEASISSGENSLSQNNGVNSYERINQLQELQLEEERKILLENEIKKFQKLQAELELQHNQHHQEELEKKLTEYKLQVFLLQQLLLGQEFDQQEKIKEEAGNNQLYEEQEYRYQQLGHDSQLQQEIELQQVEESQQNEQEEELQQVHKFQFDQQQLGNVHIEKQRQQDTSVENAREEVESQAKKIKNQIENEKLQQIEQQHQHYEIQKQLEKYNREEERIKSSNNFVGRLESDHDSDIEIQKSIEIYHNQPVHEIHYPVAQVESSHIDQSQGQQQYIELQSIENTQKAHRLENSETGGKVSFDIDHVSGQQGYQLGHQDQLSLGVENEAQQVLAVSEHQAYDLSRPNFIPQQSSIGFGVNHESSGRQNYRIDQHPEVGLSSSLEIDQLPIPQRLILGSNILNGAHQLNQQDHSHSHSHFHSYESNRDQQQAVVGLPYTLEPSKELVLPGVQATSIQIIENPSFEKHLGVNSEGEKYPVELSKGSEGGTIVEKHIPVPQPYPVEKLIEKTIHVPQPYPVEKIIEKKVPYPVDRIVEKHVPILHPYPVHINVPQPYPVEKIIEKPYPVETIVEKPIHIHVPIEKVIEKKVPVPQPYPVEVTKYVDKPVPIHVPQPYPVEKIVERIVEKAVHIRVPYPVEVVRNIPYGVQYGVSYQQIMRPHSHNLYINHGKTRPQFYGLPALTRHHEFRHQDNLHVDSKQPQQYQGYSYEKPAISFVEGGNSNDQITAGNQQIQFKHPFNLPKKSNSHISFPHFSSRRHTLRTNTKDKTRNEEYIGPVPPQRWHHQHPLQNLQHAVQARSPQSSTDATRSPTSTTTLRRAREPETKPQSSTGNFRQSRVEYGFKPPMIPSVQYDEKTASKVES